MIVRFKLIIALFIASSFFTSPIYAQSLVDDELKKGKELFDLAKEQGIDGSFDLAMKNFIKAGEVFKANDSLDLWLSTHVFFIHYLGEQGKYPQAIKWGDSIIHHLFRKVEVNTERIYFGWIHKLVGDDYLLLGNYHQGEQYLLDAEKIMKAGGYDFEKRNYSLFASLGKIYNHFREPEKAKHYFNRLIDCAEKQEKWDDVIIGYDGLAVNYFHQGKHKLELEEYQKALDLKKASAKARGRVYLNIADAYRSNQNYPKAMEMAVKAKDFYQVLAKEEEDMGNRMLAKVNLVRSLTLLGNLYTETQNYQQGKSQFHSALQVLNSSRGNIDSTEYANVLIGLANLEGEIKEWNLALKHIQKAIWYFFPETDSSDMFSHPGKDAKSKDFLAFDVFMHKAELLNKRFEHNQDINDLKLALEVLLSLNDILENSLKMYDYESAKMILARDNLLYQELAIHIALQLFQRTRDKAYAEQAYHFSETTKAMILQESINNITAWDLLDFPPHIREEEERLRRELATYEASLAEYRDFADDSTISNWERRVFAAKQAYQDLIKNIERDFPEYYELKYEPASPTLNEIGAYLKKEKAIMIEYFWGEKFLHIFALDGQEIYTHSILLDSTHLEKDLSDFIYYLGDPSNKLQGRDLSVFNQFVSDSRSLYQQLLEPMLKQMRENSNEKLVFIPGGMLGYLPFEILLTNDPTKPGADYGSLDYLLRKYRIKYDYSAKLFMNYSDLKHARNFTYGGFAPSYGKDFEIGNWKLGGLFYNQKEVEQASQIMEGDSFLDSLATKDHFLSRLGKYDILHFAMHALMDDQQPGNSGLAFYHPKNNDNIFSGNQRSIEIDSAFVNSFLYVFEIYKLRIQADLVVLSACNTGVGQLVKGEGIMSLARAFAYAGCPGLVMSLWQVDDAQTQVLMESFFANLKQGMDKDEALRQAKLSFLDSEDANHPFFWASFVQTGSSAPFQTGNNWLLYSLFVGLFILVMGGIRILIKK